MSTAEQWSQVVFTDESKFNRLGSDGRQLVRRSAGQQLQPNCLARTSHGGSILVWGAITVNGTGPLVRINGTVTGRSYVDMLLRQFVPFAARNLPEDYIFQQDNAPAHRSAICKEFMNINAIDVMDWPAQSPDLNPIENIWHIIKQQLRAREINSVDELWQQTQQMWRSISPQLCRKLITGMPRRMTAVIRARGYPTKY